MFAPQPGKFHVIQTYPHPRSVEDVVIEDVFPTLEEAEGRCQLENLGHDYTSFGVYVWNGSQFINKWDRTPRYCDELEVDEFDFELDPLPCWDWEMLTGASNDLTWEQFCDLYGDADLIEFMQDSKRCTVVSKSVVGSPQPLGMDGVELLNFITELFYDLQALDTMNPFDFYVV